MELEEEEVPPVFSFGVVADVQYADKPIGSYEGRLQRYREAPGKLEAAVKDFNKAKEQLSFVLTLGDIIDGNVTAEKTEADFEVILDKLSKLEVQPVHHVLGNHCLALPRSTLIERLKMPARYYTVLMHPGWRLIILDSMDLSVRWPEGSEELKEAREFMQEHHLGEAHPQMSTWNGGLRGEQMRWLKETLFAAERAKERVLVALHHPLVVGSAPATHLVWNHAQVRDMLVRSPSVVAIFCGHYHVGGYEQVHHTHFVTIEAILEAQPNCVAHGIVNIFLDHINIIGYGHVKSRKLHLKPM